jgi:hypothetical protein
MAWKTYFVLLTGRMTMGISRAFIPTVVVIIFVTAAGMTQERKIKRSDLPAAVEKTRQPGAKEQ